VLTAMATQPPLHCDVAVQMAVDTSGMTINDTTHEVCYKSIALGQKCPWFMEHVADLEHDSVEYPHSSHGFSTVLANVHRAHPKLAFAYVPATLPLS
jgi:hypothetical protein